MEGIKKGWAALKAMMGIKPKERGIEISTGEMLEELGKWQMPTYQRKRTGKRRSHRKEERWRMFMNRKRRRRARNKMARASRRANRNHLSRKKPARVAGIV